MANDTINAQLLAKMFLAGAANLQQNKEWINQLNVFPVPDGDTGTNMTMTISSAVTEVENLGGQFTMAPLCKAISSGSLRGARGNSGVILSQLLRGFCKEAREHEELGISELAAGMERAVETAYKAVMKPKEGTILTVAKGAASKASQLAKDTEMSTDEFIQAVIAEAEAVLAATPDMLPVLKQAGVVDSGGQGLVQVLKGAYDGFLGKEIIVSEEEKAEGKENPEIPEAQKVPSAAPLNFTYCTDFIILPEGRHNRWNAKVEADFLLFLEAIGDAVSCASDEDAIKVHLHTNDPGLAIEKALQYGDLTEIRVENMRLEQKKAAENRSSGDDQKPVEEEVSDSAVQQEEQKEFGFVAVCAGSGLEEIFTGLGVDCVISGGQTMNPSTDDILKAVSRVNARNIFVLPNNKNIILAANQAAALETGKNIVVVPSKTVPQGITAVINFIPEMDVEVNQSNMIQEIAKVNSAEITYAVRNTQIDDKEIHEGDFMGIGDSGLIAAGQGKEQVTLTTLEQMITPETALISIYYGSDVTEEEAEHLAEEARKKFSGCDVELQKGGQPVYSYILSAEE